MGCTVFRICLALLLTGILAACSSEPSTPYYPPGAFDGSQRSTTDECMTHEERCDGSQLPPEPELDLPPEYRSSTPACDDSYPDICVAPFPPDLDCKDISYKRFKVLSPDPHNFDGDGDGIGCET